MRRVVARLTPAFLTTLLAYAAPARAGFDAPFWNLREGATDILTFRVDRVSTRRYYTNRAGSKIPLRAGAEPPKGEQEEEEVDADARVLAVRKSASVRVGDRIRLRYGNAPGAQGACGTFWSVRLEPGKTYPAYLVRLRDGRFTPVIPDQLSFTEKPPADIQAQLDNDRRIRELVAARERWRTLAVRYGVPFFGVGLAVGGGLWWARIRRRRAVPPG
jgi:hypothetical protein